MKNIIINDNFDNKNLPKGFKFDNKVLVVEKNKEFDKTIKITLSNTNKLDLVIGENSKLKLIFEINNNNKNKEQYTLKTSVGKNASLKYLFICAINSEDATINHNFILKNNSRTEILGGIVSNKLNLELKCELEEKEADVDVKVVAISSDENKQKIDVNIIHNAVDTKSNMNNVGIVSKKGSIILNGIVKINKGMKNSNTYQSLKGILTSDDSYMEVNPILLIDEYDIKAGHAATVGKLNYEALYYIQSRGISKKEAEKLMIKGFLTPILSEIDEEDLKERFEKLIENRI